MFSNMTSELRKEQSIYSALKSSAEYYVDKTALIYFNKSFTYKHLLSRINQFAFALKENGIEKDDIVTICLPNIPDAIYLLYAVNQIGAIANIVHPLFSYEQMKENLHTTKSKILFALDTTYYDFLPLTKEGIKVYFSSPVTELNIFKRIGYKISKKPARIPIELTLHGFYHSPKLETFDDRYLSDAIYLHSGGTTNKPKIIALSSFAINALCYQGRWIVNRNSYEGIGMLATLPMFHGFGLAIGIHIALFDGGYDVLMPKFSAKETINYIKKNKVHILIGVPTLYEALLNKEEFDSPSLKNLLISWVGGDFIPRSLIDRFNNLMIKNNAKGRLRAGYGLTETVNVCAVNSLTHFKEDSDGINLPNVKFLIVDDKHKRAKPNVDGELLVSGETIMNGYRFGDTKDSFILVNNEKYIPTGDICSIDEDGFLYFKSRKKNVTKVSGINIFPNQIEQVVSDFDYVWEVSATPIESKRFGHIIKLFVVLNKKMDIDKDKAKEEISSLIVSKLGIYAKPVDIIFLEKMPHTILGKIDQNKLKEIV